MFLSQVSPVLADTRCLVEVGYLDVRESRRTRQTEVELAKREVAVPNSAVPQEKPRWPDVAVIGAYPPPYGGMSIHLQRLSDYLSEQGIDYVLYNTSSSVERMPHIRSVAGKRSLWFLKFCLTHRCKVVHLVSTHWPSYLLFGVTASLRPGKYMLSIHFMRVVGYLDRPGSLRARLTRWMLRKMDMVIVCNSEIERRCIETVGLSPEKVRLIPAFIPPSSREAAALPDAVRAFADAHDPLFCAFGTVSTVQGDGDTYGIDMMINMVSRLRIDYPRAGLILTILGGKPERIRQTIEAAEQEAGGSILVLDKPLRDVYHLLRSCDLFLRPTSTEGDAMSVREALYLGTPVVASDAVNRPETCVTFRTGDIDDLERKVRRALSELPALREQVQSCRMPNNASGIVEVYKRMMGEQE